MENRLISLDVQWKTLRTSWRGGGVCFHWDISTGRSCRAGADSRRKGFALLPNLAQGEDVFGSPEIRTKMKILHAVDKSLDRITIAEICENAGISRQTFYRHFESKYDIPWWHSIFCRQFYLNEIGRTIDWKTGYYHHLRLIAQERDFYRKSIQYSINTPFGQTVMPENRRTVLLDTLENYRHVTVDENMRFIVEVFSKLECEVLNDWFRSDAPTDLVRWTDDLVSLVPDRLYRALKIEEPGPSER